jgi:hypothetical protein
VPKRSWFQHETFATLRRHHVGFCPYHMVDEETPLEATPDIAYLRFHGSDEVYGGRYSDRQLADWAQRLRALPDDVRQVYVYFNNDTERSAIENANTLRSLLREAGEDAPWPSRGRRTRRLRIDDGVRVLHVRSLLHHQDHLGTERQHVLRLGNVVGVRLGAVDVQVPDATLRVAPDDEVPTDEARMTGQPFDQATVDRHHITFHARLRLHQGETHIVGGIVGHQDTSGPW